MPTEGWRLRKTNMELATVWHLPKWVRTKRRNRIRYHQLVLATSLQRIRMVWAHVYDVWSDNHQRFPELVTSMDSFELDPWRHWYWLSVIGLVFWYKKRQPPSSSPTTRVILIRRVFTLAVGVTVFLVVLTATNLWSIGLELALSEFSFRPSAK